MGKIKTLTNLQKIISQQKKQGKRVVFTNGCFDLIHPGHIRILKAAKQKGDILIVGLNSDISIKTIKNRERPIFNEKARAQILEAMAVVDFIVIFGEKTPYNLIKTLKPDVLVKGADWRKNDIVGKKLVSKISIIKIYPGYSTSSIIEKIKKSAK